MAKAEFRVVNHSPTYSPFENMAVKLAAQKTTYTQPVAEKFDMLALASFLKKRMDDLKMNANDVERESHDDPKQRIGNEHVWRLVNHPEKYKSVRLATLERLARALKMSVETLEAVARGEAVDVRTISVDVNSAVLKKLETDARKHGLAGAGEYLALLARSYYGFGINVDKLAEMRKAA